MAVPTVPYPTRAGRQLWRSSLARMPETSASSENAAVSSSSEDPDNAAGRVIPGVSSGARRNSPSIERERQPRPPWAASSKAAACSAAASERADRRAGKSASGGLRVTEMCQVRWRDVDVHHQRLIIREAKTDAGVRDVDLSLDVMEELMAWRATRPSSTGDDFVFATDSGRPRDKDSVRERVLRPVVNRTNEHRTQRGLPPLPPVSPHALRRTYISLLIEAGAPLPYVMRQVGHDDSRTTLEVYAKVQQRLSRKHVHQAFDDLLASAGETADVGTDAREKMFQSTIASSPQRAESGDGEGT
jgi:Phage integrase family